MQRPLTERACSMPRLSDLITFAVNPDVEWPSRVSRDTISWTGESRWKDVFVFGA